jgi:transposase
MFYHSRDRASGHPRAQLASYAGVFQADAHGGYGKVDEPDRKPGAIVETACGGARAGRLSRASSNIS